MAAGGEGEGVDLIITPLRLLLRERRGGGVELILLLLVVAAVVVTVGDRVPMGCLVALSEGPRGTTRINNSKKRQQPVSAIQPFVFCQENYYRTGSEAGIPS